MPPSLRSKVTLAAEVPGVVGGCVDRCCDTVAGVVNVLRAVETRDCSAALCLCSNRAMALFLEELAGVTGVTGISASSAVSVTGCSDEIAT